MIKGNRNQLANVSNQFQGKTMKVLFVCSAGLLRSPTAANTIHKRLGLNTRACGSCKDFALIPITEALIFWADEIVFVNSDNLDDLDTEERDLISCLDRTVSVLDVPDEFDWGNPELEEIIFNQFVNRKKMILEEVGKGW
jgi:predicted protein tyrosine phosphatase